MVAVSTGLIVHHADHHENGLWGLMCGRHHWKACSKSDRSLNQEDPIGDSALLPTECHPRQLTSKIHGTCLARKEITCSCPTCECFCGILCFYLRCVPGQPALRAADCPHCWAGEAGGGKCLGSAGASDWPAPSAASESHLEADVNDRLNTVLVLPDCTAKKRVNAASGLTITPAPSS